MTDSATPTEDQIIAKLAAMFSAANARILTGIGDDAAVLKPSPRAGSQVVTTDLLIEGVHFDRRYMGLCDIAYKALAVNLSDIASMGAKPVAAFGNLGVPSGFSEADIDSLLDGLAACCTEHATTLAGGDTVAAPQLVIGFTVIGEVSGAPLLRSGAQVGDIIWHSGRLGQSQAGLHMLWAGQEAEPGLNIAHCRPQPQLKLGNFLQESGMATACIDLSDSLSQCLTQLASASNVGLNIDFQQYSFAPGMVAFTKQLAHENSGYGFTVPNEMDPQNRSRQFGSLAQFVLAAAEDYQLLFTAPPTATEKLLAGSPVPLSKLGQVVDRGKGATFTDEHGTAHILEPSGFHHL